MTVRRLCANRGINVYSSFANAQTDRVILETQTTVADHARKEEIRFGGLKWSERVDLAR